MLDKAKLGSRYVCYECGTKFYDLNRPKATCPECSADQAGAPARDIRSLLSNSGKKAPEEKPAPAEEPAAAEESDEDEDEEDEEGSPVEFGEEAAEMPETVEPS